MKKAFCIAASAIVLISCSKNKQEVKIEEKVSAFKPAASLFESEKAKGKVLLLSDNLSVYDKSGEVTGSVNALYGLTFEIDSISSKRIDIAKTGDNCNIFKFVKVGKQRINGWLYSADVFGFGNSKRDTIFSAGNIKFKMYHAENFGIGASDDDGLTGCSVVTPVVIYNSKFGTEAFVPLKDKTGKYPGEYLVMDEHDGWYDKIQETAFEDGKLKLTIFREYQEGSAEFTILISLSNKGYMAEVIEVVEHTM